MFQIILIMLLIGLLLILSIWTLGFLVATDFSVPTMNTEQFRRVLVVFPHADDEVITCGGLLNRLAGTGARVTLVLLTKGEKGPNPTRAEDLKALRTQEARSVATLLRITKLLQEDFGDGQLREKEPELTTYLAALLAQEQPDLLITYDLAGLYGHPDHRVCAEIITRLKQTSFPETPLWYVTFPKRMLVRIKVPDDLDIDPQFRAKQALPTHKVFIGCSVVPKVRSWYTYTSQRAALARGIGTGVSVWLLWFVLSLVLFEYVAEEGSGG